MAASGKKQGSLLFQVDTPEDLRKLPLEKLPVLAKELREFLINTVSRTSGHLASGLGVVELTIALHYVYNTPFDQIIWDVGHQAYPHKILTGRRDQMSSIRQKNGLHPFLWRQESPYDTFSTGHASTSISEALGLALANKALNNGKKVCAVIGDGALTGGVSFEAMNHAGDLGADMLLVLNDNEMSISESVGSLAKHLAMWLSSPIYSRLLSSGKSVLENLPLVKDLAIKAQEHLKGMVVPGTLFEELGFNYVGPIDGHDISALIPVLKNMKDLKGPQILHVVTKKGKGYQPAEEDPTKYHGVPRFDPPVGISEDSDSVVCYRYSHVFGDWLMKTAASDKALRAVTPAMCEGSGMTEFASRFPGQYFDVAIAEQHAVLLASGLAAGGLRPVVCVYSTFLQRAYDQIIHDVAIQDLPIVIAIDRAGIVGADGPTHQGMFDISYMKSVPNITFMAPSTLRDFWLMLNTAYSLGHPAAVRYPRGCGISEGFSPDEKSLIPIGRAEILRQGREVCVLGWGPLVQETSAEFAKRELSYTVVNMRFIKPFDKDLVLNMADTHRVIITLEDGVISGGIGEAVAAFIMENGRHPVIRCLGIPDEFVEQDSPESIYRQYGMDGSSVADLAESLDKNLMGDPGRNIFRSRSDRKVS